MSSENYVGIIMAEKDVYKRQMIHRVVLGSIERFIGVITEHFAGAFPTWLAPVQVKVMTCLLYTSRCV